MRPVLVILSLLGLAIATLPMKKMPVKMSSRHHIRRNSHVKQHDSQPITPDFGPQIEISVGTPAQWCGFNLDTTSGDTFIVDFNDAVQPNPAPWEYDSKNSTSLKTSTYPYKATVLDINGLTADIAGNLADEVFSVFQAKFTMKFALITTVTTDPTQDIWIPDMFATGRIGAAWAHSENMDLFVPNMLKPFAQAQKQFMVALKECMPDDNEEVDYGEFMVGGYDSGFCNATTLVKAPLAQSTNWYFYIQNFYIGSFQESKRQLVQINTVEMLTGVPQSAYDAVFKMTNAVNDPNYKWPTVDCSATFPDMHFNIGGQNITVSEDLYIFRDFKDDQDTDPCHLMLYPLSGGGFLPSWSFGYLWIYRKCMVFDYGNRAILFMDYNDGICDGSMVQ